MTARALDPITRADVDAARARIGGTVVRTPLLRLDVDAPAELWLKLECLQPIGSFKLRGATNAMRRLREENPASLANGVYTASAGNMAQGVAWGARELGVPCTVVVPETAPATKLAAIERLGARVDKRRFDDWWRVIVEHGDPTMSGAFIHPFADTDVMAGNATIASEIFEDLPLVDEILVPYGGGGLACGIAFGARAMWSPGPVPAVYACEVATAAPLTAALAAGAPVAGNYAPSFVDGIGSKRVSEEMWPVARQVLDGALVVSLEAVASAVRLLVTRARVVAEGAGATAVAAGLERPKHGAKLVCVVSGGNIDATRLARILEGGLG